MLLARPGVILFSTQVDWALYLLTYLALKISRYTLLLDEAGNYRVSLAWAFVDRGSNLRFSLRAEVGIGGYVSLAFVHPDWPIQDDIEKDPE